MRSLFRSAEVRVNPFENPSTPLTSAGLLDFFGGTPTDAGVSVSEENSLEFSTVYRCVALLSGLVAGLPLKVFRYRDKSEVSYRALQQPNSAGMTPYELWETAMTHLLLWGNSYLHKVRNGAGAIVELRPIHPSRVQPSLTPGPEDDDDEPGLAKVFNLTLPGGQTVQRDASQILHIPGLGYDGIRGLSPVGLMRQTIGIGKAADRLAAQLYGNGNLLSGILQTDRQLKKDQADQLKQQWRKTMQGLSHGHDIAVMDASTKFTPLAMPPEEAQFLQSRRWQTVEVARWFGVPPHLVGDVEKSTSWGTGIEQQNIGFVAYTVRFWLTRIEQRVTWEVVQPSTQYAEFLVDALMRGDTLSRYQAYFTAIQSGWLTRNEARAKENLEPIDGLDEPLEPLKMPAGKSIGQDVPIPGAGQSNPQNEPQDDDNPDDGGPNAPQ